MVTWLIDTEIIKIPSSLLYEAFVTSSMSMMHPHAAPAGTHQSLASWFVACDVAFLLPLCCVQLKAVLGNKLTCITEPCGKYDIVSWRQGMPVSRRAVVDVPEAPRTRQTHDAFGHAGVKRGKSVFMHEPK